jgi:hypothetical protein
VVTYDSPLNTNQFLVSKFDEPPVPCKFIPGSMLDILLSDSTSMEDEVHEELLKEIALKDQRIMELQRILERHNIKY